MIGLRTTATRVITGMLGLALVSALVACSTIPISGSVQQGQSRQPDEYADVDFLADAPDPGASQEQILLGFIGAATSARENYAVAREYLTPSLSASWRSDDSVTVDVSSERVAEQTSGTEISLSLNPVAEVDATGVYRELDAQTAITRDYSFERVNGEWRIASAPDGLVIEDSAFNDVFSAHSLNFFDPTWTTLVPEVRWFPSRSSTSTRIVSSLLNGPSEWLSQSVVSAFPTGAQLNTETVPVNGGSADVALSADASGLDDEAYSRMRAQLQASLDQISPVTDVSLTVNGIEIDVPAMLPAVTRVDSRALVIVDGELGYYASGRLTPVSGPATDFSDDEPETAAISADRRLIALGTDYGTLVYRDGRRTLIDDRGGLVPPTLDNQGFVWSVPSERPASLTVVGPQGPVEVRSSWPEGVRVRAAELSRDGTRLAVLANFENDTTGLFIAGVVRAGDGTPEALSEFVELSIQDGRGRDLTWVDDRSVASLLTGPADEDITQLQEIGGRSSIIASFPGAEVLVGGNGTNQLRSLTADDRMALRRQGGWQFTASSVSVLVTQMGTPE